MTTINSLVGAPSAINKPSFSSINCKKAKYTVKRLQVRIAKAMANGKIAKVKALQFILSKSFYAKYLAVKKVTENKGKNCPGVDGVIWRTDRQKSLAILSLNRYKYKPQPLKRIQIPKKNNSNEKRPLSIPTMKDRATQALYLLGLEPAAESIADDNSYGFRPKRSTADAIEQCFTCLNKHHSAKWILEGDIKSFFDKVDHNWLVDNIPMDRTILRKFLKSGYIFNDSFEETNSGVPQGGIISPCISLITLSGLEKKIRSVYKNRQRRKVNFISYADDFIITGESKELLESEIIPIVQDFLQERGLELSISKTKITHIKEGFDFLGFNIRKYQEQCLTKPSKASIRSFLKDTKSVINAYQGSKAGLMILRLNQKIIGWTNYFKHVVSSRIFSYIDYQLSKMLFSWALKRHANKGKKWIYQKYFHLNSDKRWLFHSQTQDKKGRKTLLKLVQASSTKIQRHIKIKAGASPYNPKFDDYFAKRKVRAKILNNLAGSNC